MSHSQLRLPWFPWLRCPPSLSTDTARPSSDKTSAPSVLPQTKRASSLLENGNPENHPPTRGSRLQASDAIQKRLRSRPRPLNALARAEWKAGRTTRNPTLGELGWPRLTGIDGYSCYCRLRNRTPCLRSKALCLRGTQEFPDHFQFVPLSTPLLMGNQKNATSSQFL